MGMLTGGRTSLVAERSEAPLCRVRALSAVRFARPRMQEAVAFFEDFGLVPADVATDVALLRGRLEAPPCVELERGPASFIGLRFEVGRVAELETLAAATGRDIEPGVSWLGGHRVRLTDPDGIEVEVVAEPRRLPALPRSPSPGVNGPDALARVNETVRIRRSGPPLVAKLGHAVLGPRRLARSAAWYQRHLGLLVSDFQMLADDPLPVVVFMRCDRGDEPTDHHTLALASAVELGHLHTAFELDDATALLEAAAHLESAARKRTWGVGRHLLGSQVFDYYRDPAGDLFEHYVDGDRFDARARAGVHPFSGHSLHQWGPPPTDDMVGRVPTFARGAALLGRLARGDDLTPTRLANLLAAST